MSFLNPLFLVAAAAASIPILLHLVHRYESRRVIFPALLYLLRTEKDHARRIRLRQLLLLLARVAAILLIVAAGARAFIPGPGGAHPPTALAIVLDNSMSSGRVLGERRVLDVLIDRALETLEVAGPEDQIWVIRAGEPWDVATPGGVLHARDRVLETEPTDARGDLTEAIRRARSLVSSEGLPASEIHLLSDLQRSGFQQEDVVSTPPAGDVPVITFQLPDPAESNRFVSDVVVGGGLAPLAGQRTEVAATVSGDDTSQPAARPVRVVTDGRIRAAGSVVPGETALFPVGPFPRGAVTGFIETDPDALRADDRRFFAFEVRPPVRTRAEGAGSFFLDHAVGVLEEAGRIQLIGPGEAQGDAIIAVGGAGLTAPTRGPALVIPPTDPVLLPALNRRLSEAGIPWLYGPPVGTGSAPASSLRLETEVDSVRVHRAYALTSPSGDPVADTAATLPGGEPWIVLTKDDRGPVTLLATPLDPSWSELPLSAGMIPFVEWAITGRGQGAGSTPLQAGDPMPLPSGVTGIRTPTGADLSVGGGRVFLPTGDAGVYQLLSGTESVAHVAVNPPPEESLLTPVQERDLSRLAGPSTILARSEAAWSRSIFQERQGPEVWWPLLALALALLLAESWLASVGTRASAQ